jgi:predicted nucleic acid-binding protein
VFLLDTTVLSSLRRPARHPVLAEWARGLDPNRAFVSVLTLGEVEAGIERARRTDPAFAESLDAWLQVTRAQFADRILPFDLEAALIWGRLIVEVGYSGVDTQLAASALRHDLTVATRNTRHFETTGVRVLNPFEAA